MRQPADRINESALRSTISEDEKTCDGRFRAQIYFNDAKIFNLFQPQGGAADPANLVSKPQARQIQFVGWALLTGPDVTPSAREFLANNGKNKRYFCLCAMDQCHRYVLPPAVFIA